MSDYDLMIGENTVPIKMWTRGVSVEQEARNQLVNIAQMPFIHKHLAVMPDVHLGKGATVGSVVPTKGAIIPAAVGVDIGCGMMAWRTDLTAADLPDSLAAMRSDIEAAVPHGRTDNGGDNDRGAWGSLPEDMGHAFIASSLPDRFNSLLSKHDRLRKWNLGRCPRGGVWTCCAGPHDLQPGRLRRLGGRHECGRLMVEAYLRGLAYGMVLGVFATLGAIAVGVYSLVRWIVG